MILFLDSIKIFFLKEEGNIYKILCTSNFKGLWLWCLTHFDISVISWRSVLLVEEARVPGENHRQVIDKLYRKKLYLVHFVMSVIRTHTSSGDRH